MTPPARYPASLDQAADGRETNAGADSKFLNELVESTIIHPEDWATLPREMRDGLANIPENERAELLRRLADLHLLNAYQVGRLEGESRHGLVLGHYRVLDKLGAGGASVVFIAEHLLMRRKVAIKVLPVYAEEELDSVKRFLREVQCVARLEHPNIVSAFDAGIYRAPRAKAQLGAKGMEAGKAGTPPANANEPDLYYFVMEHLTGSDLEVYVEGRQLSVAEACTLIYQAASGLDEAHRHQLIHRDIKPANIFITEDGIAKLLDFGLVRQLRAEALTAPGVVVGTLDFMAPEQALQSAPVDIRADIFSLGATLFYALTGRSPFSSEGSFAAIVNRRLTEKPLSAFELREDIPLALDQVLNQMMAPAPADRYQTPQAVMHALLPFLESTTRSRDEAAMAGNDKVSSTSNGEYAQASASVLGSMLNAKPPCVLVAEAEAGVREPIVKALKSVGFKCLDAASDESVRAQLQAEPVDAVLLSTELPGGGAATLKALRDNPPHANLKILMTSARANSDEMAQFLSGGADDYLDLPMNNVELRARVHAAVKHKEAQERVDRLSRQHLELNVRLERSLDARTTDLVQARNSLVLALARLVEYRSTETTAHLSRMQRYAATLAQEAAALPGFARIIDEDFIQTLECCTPLHDIGNIGLPDAILLKPGRLEADEREIMQKHTRIGAEMLQQVAHRIGPGASFLRMAIDIARHHHENFDGSGYPDALVGEQIPLAARIVAIADAYDAMRSRRAQRPALSHAVALQFILDSSTGKFDPQLLRAFQQRVPQFERIFRELPDSINVD